MVPIKAYRHFTEYYIKINDLKKCPGIMLPVTGEYAAPGECEIAGEVEAALNKLMAENNDPEGKADENHPLNDWVEEEGAEGQPNLDVCYLWLNLYSEFDTPETWVKIKDALGLPDDIMLSITTPLI